MMPACLGGGMPGVDTGIVDVAIVGSGPAGLSAAAHAASKGMSHVLLEKTDHLSDTIFKYQKGKHVMATPSHLVLRADLDFDAGKREAILDTWNRQIAERKVEVMLDAEVTAIEGEAGDFTITLKRGATVRAKAVVLAIGTQGNPNLLRLPGADLPHVQYQLDDPTEYIDEHITVIGSGDAGIENALGLAADPKQGNVVTILNRGADFARAKAANAKLLLEAESEGRIFIKRETEPAEVLRPDHRAHRVQAAPRFHREVRCDLFERGSRILPRALAAIRIDQARALRDRRARRVSADQALHEPGLRRDRVPCREYRTQAG
jgi:cGMP-dependent protein kinase 2